MNLPWAHLRLGHKWVITVPQVRDLSVIEVLLAKAYIPPATAGTIDTTD